MTVAVSVWLDLAMESQRAAAPESIFGVTMSNRNIELSIEDVEFLQAVRHIEENPEGFEGETGEATTGSLRRLLAEVWETTVEWSKGMISYRMNGPDKASGCRGWDSQEGFGLVRLHGAELTQDGWTSRSIELTEKGREWLERKEKKLDLARSGSGASERSSSADVEALEIEIERLEQEKAELENRVEDLEETVDRFVEAKMGALDADAADQLQNVFNRVLRQTRVNQQVFGIDTDPFQPGEDPSQEDVATARRSAAQSLSDFQDQ